VQVYLARQEGAASHSRDVVLRIVSKLADQDAKAFEELRRDAGAFSKLQHPAIVRTYEFFEHENSLVFVLEHIDGMSLSELTTTTAPNGARPFSDEAAYHVAISICDALAHAHRSCDEQGRSRPVIHKGVSPSKVRVCRDGTVKLGGFGLTKPFGITVDRNGHRQWQSPYLAPEQILGQPPSTKADVYAAGLILWELLTGRSSTMAVPQDALAVEGAIKALVERTFDPVASARPDLPRALAAAVDAALTSAPEKRTIGCKELAQEIRKHARVGRGKEEMRARVQGGPSPIDTQAAAAVPTPRVPPPPPPAHRPRTEALSRPPHLPVAAEAAAQPITASPIVTIDSPSRLVAPPQPLAPLPIEPVTGSTMEVPASTRGGPHEVVPAGSAELERSENERPTVPGDAPNAAWIPTSILQRLRAPSQWQPTTRLATFIGVPLALALLVATVAITRSPRASKSAEAAATTVALADVHSTALPIPATSSNQKSDPPAQEPRVAVAPTAQPRAAQPVPTAKVAAIAPVAPTASDDFSMALKKRHLGHLTVHSYASYARVFLMFTKYGRVEEKLTVPCGQRFVAIGLPPRAGKHEPIWLAPGTSIFVPCGGSLTVTMNPRRVR
jgi:serine/threonine-protein kinase